jgi:predicted DNA-binding protein
MWCKVVFLNLGANAMKKSVQMRNEGKSVRTSVTLPRDVYQTLVQLSEKKKVTVAWIIRDAADKYVGEQWPLLRREAA